MSSCPSFISRKCKDSSPYLDKIDNFSVQADAKSKTLVCSMLSEFRLLVVVRPTPSSDEKNLKVVPRTLIEEFPITADEGYKLCMADSKCREFAQPYLNRGFIFQSKLEEGSR